MDKAERQELKDQLEMGNIFSEDKNNIDLLNNLDHARLLDISKLFSLYPDQVVTLDEFVDIMKSVMNDSKIS